MTTDDRPGDHDGGDEEESAHGRRGDDAAPDHGADGAVPDRGADGAVPGDEQDATGDRPEGGGWYGEPPDGWDEEAEDAVFGPSPGEGDEDVEPGDPRFVHVLFVLLGALVTLAALADLVGLL